MPFDKLRANEARVEAWELKIKINIIVVVVVLIRFIQFLCYEWKYR